VCEVHGSLLTQCRCPSPDKTEVRVPCPGPRCPGAKQAQPEVRRYADWHAALGNPIPGGNQQALFDWLVAEWPDRRDEAAIVVPVVARAVSRDKPFEALQYLRGLLGRNETAVIQACAVLCCPPSG
jgi:hypothetical protein